MRDPLEELTQIGRMIAQCKALLNLFDNEGWFEFLELVKKDCDSRLNRLCVPDIDQREADRLRGEIWSLRWLMRMPKMTRNDIEELAKRATALHKRVEVLHTRGHDRADPEASEVLAEARKLQQQLQGLT